MQKRKVFIFVPWKANSGKRMQKERRLKHSAPSYDVIFQKRTTSRVYRLVKLSLPNVSTNQRKRVIETLLDGRGAIGLIEWWMRGSIVKKPKWQFYCLLVFKA
jgi:hypothetical protein